MSSQMNDICSKALPPGVSLARDAKVALNKVANVAALIIATVADDRRQRSSKRATLSVDDVREALGDLGFSSSLSADEGKGAALKRPRPT